MNSEIIVIFVIILYCPTMSKIMTINYLLANGKNLIANKALIGDGNTYMPLLGMFLFYSGEMREIILFSVMEIEPQVLCVPSVHSALEPHLWFLWRKQTSTMEIALVFPKNIIELSVIQKSQYQVHSQ